MQFKLRLISAAVATVMVVACGGGSDSSITASYTPSSGVAVDGYLQFAKILCDTNGNGVGNTGEPVTYTRIDGKFTFPQGCASGLIATGGKNADTGLLFTGELRAPAGATVVSPLTTLLAAGMTPAQLIAALDLPAGTNLLNTDPAALNTAGVVVAPLLLKKTLALQQVMQKTTELFAGLASVSGSSAIEAIAHDVAIAFATALKTSAPLVTGTTVSDATINAMLKKAAEQMLASTTVLPAVQTALAAAGGATKLADVAGTGLKVQAQAYFAAGDGMAAITAATLDRQANENITTTIKAAVTAGTLSPVSTSTQITTLAAQTATAAASSAPVIPVLPPPAGTLLASFDESTPLTVTEFGGAGYAVEPGPSGGSGNALKITRPGGEVYAGAWIATPTIAFTATRKTVTARVYSPTAGVPMIAKAEYADQQGTGDTAPTTPVVQGWQTLTWVFNNVDLTKAHNRFVVLPNLGTVGTGQAYYIDDIALAPAAVVVVPTGPTTAAPTPTVAAGNVISLFSDAYTNLAGTDFFPNWSQSTVVTEEPIAGNTTKKLANLNYQGVQLAGATNVSAMTSLHIDVWSPAVGNFTVGLINSTAVASAVAKTEVTRAVVAGWNSLDIPLTNFTAPDLTKIDQLVFSGSGTVYYDNLYFWRPVAAPVTDFLYLTGDSLGYTDGTSTTSYTMAQFQSAAGINVKWPMAPTAALKLSLAQNGNFTLASNQTLTAAVAITQDTPAGSGEVKAYIDNVSVAKVGNNIVLMVPATAIAKVFGISGNGQTKAVIDFASSVRNVTNTLSTAASAISTVVLGDVVNFAVNGVSNDFTGINALRGKYKVTLVVTNLPLRKADGTTLPALTIQVPTSVDSSGTPGSIVPVTGPGLEGFITLTN